MGRAMPERRRSRPLPEEIRFFARLAAFGFALGTVYWFVSYEVAGTVLLLAFGLATAVASAFLLAQLVRAEGRPAGPPWRWLALAAADADGPFGDPVGRVPVGSLAPLVGGFGVTLMALGLIYGPPLMVVGLFPAAWGAWEWVRAVSAEWRVAARDEDRRRR